MLRLLRLLIVLSTRFFRCRRDRTAWSPRLKHGLLALPTSPWPHSRCTRARPDRVQLCRPRRGEGGRARSLKLDVVAHTVTPNDPPQQVGASVVELRYEITTLVTRIGERQRFGTFGDTAAGQDLDAFRASQHLRIQPQVRGQFHIQLNQVRCRDRGWVKPDVETLRQSRIGVFEAETDGIEIGTGGGVRIESGGRLMNSLSIYSDMLL